MGIVRTRDPLPRIDKGVCSAESVYEFKWIRDQIAGNEDDDDEVPFIPKADPMLQTLLANTCYFSCRAL